MLILPVKDPGESPDLIAKAKAIFESARTDSPDWPIKDAEAGEGQQSRRSG